VESEAGSRTGSEFETSVPGQAPDPAITHVGAGNLCPGCESAEVRTLCRGEDSLYQATERTFLVVECRECRMVRLYPRPAPEEMRRFYPDATLDEHDTGAPWGLHAFVERVLIRDMVQFVRQALRQVPCDGPVLDVGCGEGWFLRQLDLPQRRLVGLDFSVDAAAEAWSSNGVPAVCAALPNAPFAAGTFAAITLFQVLEHLYDPLQYIEAAARLLHPEGRLIVQVPNAGSWQFLLLGERWSGLDVPRHLLIYREQDIENLLEFAGFEIVRRKRFALRDNPLMLALSIAPALSRRVRRLRRIEENRSAGIFKDVLFTLLWLIALPLAAIESVCRSGATYTVEARLKRHVPESH